MIVPNIRSLSFLCFFILVSLLSLSSSSSSTTTTTTSSSPTDLLESTSSRVNLAPGFTIHSVCAFENVRNMGKGETPNQTGGGIPNTLELFTTAWKGEEVASGEVKGGLLGAWEGTAPVFTEIPVTLLYRTTFDLISKKLVSHVPVKGMENTVVEHPHINPNYEGKVVRYLYFSLGSQTGVSSPPLGYMRLDLLTGEKQEWYAPQHTYCEEVVIVPKHSTEKGNDIDGNEKEVDTYIFMLIHTYTYTYICSYIHILRMQFGFLLPCLML